MFQKSDADVSAKTLLIGLLISGEILINTGFHVKSKDLLQGIVTLCYLILFWIQ